MVMQVNFLTKLVSLRPGKTVRDMIKNVMLGKEEGADSSDDEVGSAGGIAGRVRFCSEMISFLFENSKSFSTIIFFCSQASVSGRKPSPVRPGMFLETVSKVKSF